MFPLHLLPLAAFLLFSPVSSESPSPCPPGSFLDGPQCSLCPAGTFSELPDSTSCTPCPAVGTFNPVSGAQTALACRPCPADTFAPFSGNTFCFPCPGGTTSAFHATTCGTCPAGTRLSPRDNRCRPCDGRSVTTTPNSIICTPCPLNHKADASGTRCRPCPPGTRLVLRRGFLSGNYVCRLCPGFAVNDGSSEECQPCPAGTGPNRSRTRCIPCRPGTARLNARRGCEKCEEGENVGVRGSELCLPSRTLCPSGYFRNRMGGCRACNRGERFDPMSLTCVPCGGEEESSGGVSTTCRPCGRLQVRTDSGCRCRPGAETIQGKRCRLCPAGTFSNNPFPEVHCERCREGTFSDRQGSAECTNCPTGTVSLDDGTGCRECSSGEIFVFQSLTDVFANLRDINRPFASDGTLRDTSGMCVDPRTFCPTGFIRVGRKTRFSSGCRESP